MCHLHLRRIQLKSFRVGRHRATMVWYALRSCHHPTARNERNSAKENSRDLEYRISSEINSSHGCKVCGNRQIPCPRCDPNLMLPGATKDWDDKKENEMDEGSVVETVRDLNPKEGKSYRI